MGAMASFVINAHASRPCPCTKPIWAPPSPSQGGTGDMRIYLVVIDESPEASVALRFAARRAVKTGGAVEILALLPPPEFVQWGGVRSEEHTSELQSLMRISYAVFCLNKKKKETR